MYKISLSLFTSHPKQILRLFGRLLLALLIILPVVSLTGKTPVYAQGNQVCFRNGWGQGGIEITNAGSIPSPISPNTSITVTIEFRAINDVPFWGETARNYQIKGTPAGEPDVYANISNLDLINTDTYRATFSLPGSTFAQLTNDQQTGYALNLSSNRGSTCFLGSYTVAQDGQPPTTSCTRSNQGECGATAGCNPYETCSVAADGATPECRKIAGSCGNLACGSQGDPETTVCGCAGGSFEKMSSSSINYCCGWLVNGACTAAPVPFAANCGSNVKITSKSGLDLSLPSSTASHTVVLNYDFKDEDVTPLTLFIQSGVNTYQTSNAAIQTVNSNSRKAVFTLDNPQMFVAHPDDPSKEREYVVELRSSKNGNQVLCSAGYYMVTNDPVAQPVETCSAGYFGRCGRAGGCTDPKQICTQSQGCVFEVDKCGYTDQNTGGNTEDSEPGSILDGMKGPTNDTFNALNPLNIAAGRPGESARSPFFNQLQTPGGVLSRVLVFAFPIAGIILFLMIVWGGFEMVTGATNAKSMDAGKQRITAAVIGFILLFSSYWLMQIIETVFGLAIL